MFQSENFLFWCYATEAARRFKSARQLSNLERHFKKEPPGASKRQAASGG